MAASHWRPPFLSVSEEISPPPTNCPTMHYLNELTEVKDGPSILADYPEFVEPLLADRRLLTPPLVDEPDADLTVRCWRWWYNARGIVEMENRLQGRATALLMVHPWGIDDGHGLPTPEPAGVAFCCTREKNLAIGPHIREVINPFLLRLRPGGPVIRAHGHGRDKEQRRQGKARGGQKGRLHC